MVFPLVFLLITVVSVKRDIAGAEQGRNRISRRTCNWRRAMRRTDKEITDRNLIDAIIRKSLVCRIAMYDGRMPYIVPLSFGYDGRYIYLHSAREGRKITILKRNPLVCFEFATECEVLPRERVCSFTMRYRSVIGYGNACFLEHGGERIAALQVILSQYTDKTFALTEAELEKIAVIRIAIEEISGKQSGFDTLVKSQHLPNPTS